MQPGDRSPSGQDTVEVFQAYDDDADGTSDAIVEVVLPSVRAEVTEDILKLYVALGLASLLVGTALVARGVPRAVAQEQREGLVVAARLTSSLLVSACDTAGAAARAAGRVAGGDPGLAARTAQDLVDSRLADGVRVTGPCRTSESNAGASGARSNQRHAAASTPAMTSAKNTQP